MADEWSNRLSEYLDDELEPGDRRALEHHLTGCRECVATLAELRAVVGRAAALEDRSPDVDLWPGIAARIAPARPSEVVSRISNRARRDWLHRRFIFSAPQLAAAGLALMVLSGAAVWQLRARLQPTGESVQTSLVPMEAQAPADVVPVDFGEAQHDAAVADLQRAVREGRNQLDPTTVKILEQNLALIDEAIAQARRALTADPANTYLTKHLVDSRRRKLDLLRRAAALVVAGNEIS